MEIHISKRDVVWGYIGQFFNIAAGFLTLPLILHMLSTEEIAMNYLMLSVSTLVALMDFGFTPQVTRLVSYVYSGAETLDKEGYTEIKNNTVSYLLLFKLIKVTKKIYQRISLISLLLLMTVGTCYMYRVTNGFKNVDNSLLIWIVFSISTFFTIYYKYYDALLIGRACERVKEIYFVFKITKYNFNLCVTSKWRRANWCMYFKFNSTICRTRNVIPLFL